MPPHHPARQMHDTFYLEGFSGFLLRTHTSPVQIRAMRSAEPPFYMIASGPTYRRDYDQTHTPMFHQLEGLVIDKGIDMGHLKGCLQHFCRVFFSTDVVLRFRPSFFPFTEPSAEVDIAFQRDSSGGLRLGGDDWMEILGCGMVHPSVLRACSVDAETWGGFAFGMGIERLAMLKYGIRDLRLFLNRIWAGCVIMVFSRLACER